MKRILSVLMFFQVALVHASPDQIEDKVQALLAAQKVIQISPRKLNLIKLNNCSAMKETIEKGEARVFIVKRVYQTNLYITAAEDLSDITKCSDLLIW